MLAAYLAFPGSLFPDDFRLEKGWVFRKATCKTFIAHFISQIAYKDSEVVLKKERRIIVDQRLPGVGRRGEPWGWGRRWGKNECSVMGMYVVSAGFNVRDAGRVRC